LSVILTRSHGQNKKGLSNTFFYPTIILFQKKNVLIGSLTRRPKRSLCCLRAEATWQLNEQNCKLNWLKISKRGGCFWVCKLDYAFVCA